MAGTHATLSPSSAVRRILCAGSLAACKHLPEDAPSKYAADGTVTHQVSERCLTDGMAPDFFLGTEVSADGFTFTVDAERVERVEKYVSAIRARVGRRRVEMKLDTSKVVGVPGQSGTGDCVVFNRTAREVEVHDLKDGSGIVFAWTDPGEGLPRWRGINPQLGEYGGSALELADMLGDFDTVRLCIHQYRIGHYDEAVFTRAEIEAWVAWARPREQLAYRLWESGTPEEIRANLTPHPKACQWCPLGKIGCPARTEEILEMFPKVSVDDGGLRATALDDAQLAEALERVDEISAWCRDVQAEALRRAIAGRKVPGWKIVTGREGNRAWNDVKKVEEFIKTAEPDMVPDMYTEPQLVNPTEAERRCKKGYKVLWANLQQFITRAPGSPSLVRDHDQRPPLAIGGGVEFGLVPVGTEPPQAAGSDLL